MPTHCHDDVMADFATTLQKTQQALHTLTDDHPCTVTDAHANDHDTFVGFGWRLLAISWSYNKKHLPCICTPIITGSWSKTVV